MRGVAFNTGLPQVANAPVALTCVALVVWPVAVAAECIVTRASCADNSPLASRQRTSARMTQTPTTLLARAAVWLSSRLLAATRAHGRTSSEQVADLERAFANASVLWFGFAYALPLSLYLSVVLLLENFYSGFADSWRVRAALGVVLPFFIGWRLASAMKGAIAQFRDEIHRAEGEIRARPRVTRLMVELQVIAVFLGPPLMPLVLYGLLVR